MAKKKPPPISADTARLFGAEVNNEAQGGVSPSTLCSALDSLQQGYDPRMDLDEEEWDADLVEREIKALIKFHGEDTPLEELAGW